MNSLFDVLQLKKQVVDEIYDIVSRMSVLIAQENFPAYNKLNAKFDQCVEKYNRLDAAAGRAGMTDRKCVVVRAEIRGRLEEISKIYHDNRQKATEMIESYKKNIRQINNQRKSEMEYGSPIASQGIYIDRES